MLYERWGKQLFEQEQFYQAFEVIADGAYRYPDNADFQNNCRLAFTKALHQLWNKKDWETAEEIILEMNDLNIATEREGQFQKAVLKSWINYFMQQDKKKETRRAIELLNNY